MLFIFTRNKYYFLILLLHTLIAIAATNNRFFIIGWFYVTAITSVFWTFHNKNIDNPLSFFIVYLASMELIGRIVLASPYMPYETSKYLMFVLLLYGIFVQKHNKGTLGYLLIMLLVPAFFFDLSGEVKISDFIFNILGPINVGLAVIYFWRQQFSYTGFINLLRLIYYPLFLVLVYTFIRTPNFEDIEFKLGSNFAVSAGFGTNQVSTIMGLGMFLSFVFYIKNWPLSGDKVLDLFLTLAFAFQGLLTFSRGGMIIAFAGIIIMLIFPQEKTIPLKLSRQLKFITPALILLYAGFKVANSITGGKLLLRYQGETEGTLAGTKEKDIDVLTSNRASIFLGDVELFFQNPLLGVGAGASRYIRPKETGTIAHVELSRLLAEHGMLGLIYFVLLLYPGVKLYKKMRYTVNGNLKFALYMIALGSTFHAATRTFVTPLLFGLSFVEILPASNEQIENTIDR